MAPGVTQRLHHTAIEVRDLDGAIAWYRDHLDFTFERRFELADPGIAIAYMVNDALRIELMRRAEEGNQIPSNTGFRPAMHICFEVDDIEAAAGELRRRGVLFAQEPKLIAPARVRNLWIRAFEGHLIEFLEVLS